MRKTSEARNTSSKISQIVMNEKDITKITNNYLNPDDIADSPAGLFEGLEYKYKSTKGFRKAGQTENQIAEDYYNFKDNVWKLDKIYSDIDSLKKIKIVCDDPKVETDLVIISIYFKARDYRKLFFSKKQYELKLKEAKGDTIKNSSRK